MTRRTTFKMFAAAALAMVLPKPAKATVPPDSYDVTFAGVKKIHVFQRFEDDGSFCFAYFRTVEWDANGKLLRVGPDERIIVPVKRC